MLQKAYKFTCPIFVAIIPTVLSRQHHHSAYDPEFMLDLVEVVTYFQSRPRHSSFDHSPIMFLMLSDSDNANSISSSSQCADLHRGHIYLMDLASRNGIPVFHSIDAATAQIAAVLNINQIHGNLFM